MKQFLSLRFIFMDFRVTNSKDSIVIAIPNEFFCFYEFLSHTTIVLIFLMIGGLEESVVANTILTWNTPNLEISAARL